MVLESGINIGLWIKILNWVKCKYEFLKLGCVLVVIIVIVIIVLEVGFFVIVKFRFKC